MVVTQMAVAVEVKNLRQLVQLLIKQQLKHRRNHHLLKVSQLTKTTKLKRRKTAEFIDDNENDSNSMSQDQFQHNEDKNKKKSISRMQL